MLLKKVLANNDRQFVSDFRKATEIMVWAQQTGTYLKIRKSEIAEIAEESKIHYRLTDKIFSRKRISMVII